MNKIRIITGLTICYCTIAFLCHGQVGKSKYTQLHGTNKIQQILIKTLQNQFEVDLDMKLMSIDQVLDVDSIYFDDGDLLFIFTNRLYKPKRLVLELDIALYQKNNQFPLAKKVISRQGGSSNFEVQFNDLIEKGVYSGESYLLQINSAIFGTFDSSQAPRFQPKYKAISLGSITTGSLLLVINELILRDQQESLYNQYQETWDTGNIKDDGLFEKITRIKEDRETLNDVSLITIGGGILILGWQFRNYLIEKKILNTYSVSPNKNLKIMPSLNNSFGLLYPGVKLNYEF